MGRDSGTDQPAVSSTPFMVEMLSLKSLRDPVCMALQECPMWKTLKWLEGPGEPVQGHVGCVDNAVEDAGVHVENSDGGARDLDGTPPHDA